DPAAMLDGFELEVASRDRERVVLPLLVLGMLRSSEHEGSEKRQVRACCGIRSGAFRESGLQLVPPLEPHIDTRTIRDAIPDVDHGKPRVASEAEICARGVPCRHMELERFFEFLV